tara:strand:- start:716 stop:919 length:204 start_codon:yes stop_codon:yes gene_type:complete
MKFTEEQFKKFQDDFIKEASSKANKANKQKQSNHDYSGSEAWRDVKKTAVVMSTAMLVLMSCFIKVE